MFKPIVITNVKPSSSFVAKTEIDRPLRIEASIFKDGHEMLLANIKYFKADLPNQIKQIPLKLFNGWEDQWEAHLFLTELGSYFFSLEAWVNVYGSWLSDLQKRIQANAIKKSDLLEGKNLVERAASKNTEIYNFFEKLQKAQNQDHLIEIFFHPELKVLMEIHQEKHLLTVYDQKNEIWVEPIKARFAAWYEMFPRSAANSETVSGTFKDCIEHLPYIKDLGFDTIYFPPIHPIGITNRKGKNNSLKAEPNDIGCPWAIQDHKQIHSDLGTFEDFKNLIQAARKMDLEIALDFAIQCAPDHLYLTEHPDWFYIRSDGSIKYAENPPKEYQDIYPLNFWCASQEQLWQELKSIIEFWLEQGISTFRVDNPHTKPFAFWEWLIREIKKAHPEAIFLAEAFTAKHKMDELARLGFSQSYTYFTWRNSAHELQDYISQITNKELSYFFRGNLFANTPDILNEYLQKGGRKAFIIRAILAATLSSVYGIYSGFEICENTPVHQGSEEYLDSEKYQLKVRNWNAEGNIKNEIKLLNRLRQENMALHFYNNLKFQQANNSNLIAYSKSAINNNILVIVNTNPFTIEEGQIKVDWKDLNAPYNSEYKLLDLLSGETYTWHDAWNYVKIETAHIFRLCSN